jgi:hypothetical protein
MLSSSDFRERVNHQEPIAFSNYLSRVWIFKVGELLLTSLLKNFSPMAERPLVIERDKLASEDGCLHSDQKNNERKKRRTQPLAGDRS